MDKQFKAHNLDREDMLDKAFHTNVVEIKKMAEQKYPDPNLSANPLTYGKRIGFVDGYIAAGATSSSTVKELEAEKLKRVTEENLKAYDKLWNEKQDALATVKELEREVERLKEVLRQCDDYFDNYADADYVQEKYSPNPEMVLLSTIRQHL